MNYSPVLLTDFYKINHRYQYPPGTTSVYSTWTARESHVDGVDHVVCFGVQAFIQHYLVDYFRDNFFSRPLDDVLAEYVRLIKNTLGEPNPATRHIESLWELGYLPLEVRALPEGTLVPLRVPSVTFVNTHPEFFWLTNFIETIFSAEVWLPTTSATIAYHFRRMFEDYARQTGAELQLVKLQGHDFSFRGMGSVQAAASSGAGHLLSFDGTDTIPAILYLEKFYGANTDVEMVGASIPATEHSVMSAYGNEGPDDEFATFERLVSELYPSGFVSIVADTWDLWRVVRDYLPRLRGAIMRRDGRVVIRPDSGDPVEILTGSDDAVSGLAGGGLVAALWDTFGGVVNDKGFRHLDPHIGVIYGDQISFATAARILERLRQQGFASTNVVFGIGAHTYQRTNRDTFGHAFKSTSVIVNGVERSIYKDPVTDPGHVKRSSRGRVAVVREGGDLRVIDGLRDGPPIEGDQLRVVFRDGAIDGVENLETIRRRLWPR